MKNEMYNVLTRLKLDRNLSSSELLTQLDDEIEKLSDKREELDRMDSYYKLTGKSNPDSLKFREQNLKELVSVSETLGILKTVRETLIERENIETNESDINATENNGYRKSENLFLSDKIEEEIHKKTLWNKKKLGA